MPQKNDPRLTDLGMHYVEVGGEVVLIAIKINMPKLLNMHARRLVKSKHGTANLSGGTVRMCVASLDDLERTKKAQETLEELARLRSTVLQHDLDRAATYQRVL